MENERLIPIMRFKKFTDDWEQRKLGDISDFITKGATPTTYGFDWVENGIPFFRNDSIKDNVFVYGDYSYITEEANTALNRSEIKADDILVAITGDIGKVGIVPKGIEKGNINQHMARVRILNDAVPYFVYQYLSTDNIQREYLKIKTGLSMPQLSLEQIRNTDIELPSYKEQEKIAKHFANLDNLIALHQRKCEALKQLKKGMLQKMFPRDGAEAPEFRFKGFTDAWEQRKLGDVIEDYVEKTTVEDQYPVLTSSQQKGIVLQDEYFSGERVSQNGNIGYFVIPRGYFAYRSRSDNDVFVFNRNDAIDIGIISYFYPVFKPMGVDSNFLLRRLNYGLEEQIKINSEGTGQHVLSLKKFKNIIGVFPSYEEQKLIGNYFKELDNFITLNQRKCDALKELKKGFLQKMFI